MDEKMEFRVDPKLDNDDVSESESNEDEDNELVDRLYKEYFIKKNVKNKKTKKKVEKSKFYRFDIEKDRKNRKWYRPTQCQCLVLQNERELNSTTIEHFEPLLKKQVKQFEIQHLPFDEGGVRYAFLMKIEGEGDKVFVSKCFKQWKEDVLKELREDIRIQACAKRIAEEFMRDLKDKMSGENVNMPRLRFIGIDTLLEIEMKDSDSRTSKIWMSVEEYIQKEEDDENGFTKFSSQMNEISESFAGKKKHPLCHAFSHYSCYVTNGYLLLCDIQGIFLSKRLEYVLTDPAIHSFVGVDGSGKFESSTNFGVDGMKEFLSNHQCNEYCRKLGIDSWDFNSSILFRTMEIRKQREMMLNSEDEDENNDNKKKEEEEENAVMDIMNEIDFEIFEPEKKKKKKRKKEEVEIVDDLMKKKVDEILKKEAKKEDEKELEELNQPKIPQIVHLKVKKKEKKKKKKKKRKGIIGKLFSLAGPICKVKTKKMKV